VETTSNT